MFPFILLWNEEVTVLKPVFLGLLTLRLCGPFKLLEPTLPFTPLCRQESIFLFKKLEN